MLDSLNNLPYIKRGIESLIKHGKIKILTDNGHRLEFNMISSDVIIRLFVIIRTGKIVMKTSLYAEATGKMIESNEITIPLKGGKPDGRKQLFYLKNFSNFLKTI